jgi:trk system potassium uptake protein TrkH
LFHSVSAFCNAGFALQSDSLVQYRYSAFMHLVFVPLIVAGGLGFPVLENVAAVGRHRWRRWRERRSGRAAVPPMGHVVNLSAGRLSLHSKLVLTTTAALYLYGVAGMAASQLRPFVTRGAQAADQEVAAATEWRGSETIAGTLADASFMSVTARTAGFNTMPMDEVEPAGRFVLITLMLVGASPGGTGGGMKTTTLAIIVLTIGATLRQRERTEAFGREIGNLLVRRAATMAASLVVLATVSTLLLTLSETGPYINLAFEAVSAATTTGLSLGTTTSSLTGFGKVVIIVTMFLGRVGPLALLGALMFGLRSPRPYRLPREAVVMG